MKQTLKGLSVSTRNIMIFVIMSLPMVMNQGALREAIAVDPDPKSMVNCDIQQRPCTRKLAGMTVTLDIQPKPVMAMKNLNFLVTLSGGDKTAAPYIDLSMPGMNMGPNRVELRPVRNSVYEGQGIIVRCPSGRRTWKATVTLPEVGKVEFVFDVIY